MHGMSHRGAVRARLGLTEKSRLRVCPRGHKVLRDFLHITGTETQITTQNSLRGQLTWGKRRANVAVKTGVSDLLRGWPRSWSCTALCMGTFPYLIRLPRAGQLVLQGSVSSPHVNPGFGGGCTCSPIYSFGHLSRC